MKNIFDLLNLSKVNPDDYEVTELTDTEKSNLKNHFHSAVKHSNHHAARSCAVIAACMACVIGLSQTAFAQNAFQNILNSINIGHNQVVQLSPDTKENAAGAALQKGAGKVGSGKDRQAIDNETREKDMNKVIARLQFKPFLPQKLPAGYALDYAGTYTDKNGKSSGNYFVLKYAGNGAKISVQERRICKETAYYESVEGSVEKIKINGHDAALVKGKSVEWEANGVGMDVTAKDLSRSELISLAESFAQK